MTKNFILIFLVGSLCSCLSVEFNKPQPYWCDNLSEFPKEMQGRFYTNENDTIEIGKDYYKQISSNPNSTIDTDLKTFEHLSDSVLLKKYKKNYFLNSKENENWKVSMVKLNKDKSFTVYAALEAEDKIMKKLYNIKDKTILRDENEKATKIILNPTKKEFQKILKSKLFVEYIIFKKIN